MSLDIGNSNVINLPEVLDTSTKTPFPTPRRLPPNCHRTAPTYVPHHYIGGCGIDVDTAALGVRPTLAGMLGLPHNCIVHHSPRMLIHTRGC